jgi:hypothetical protein
MANGDTDEHYQKASRAYSVSLMNNTKWRKLFSSLARAGVKIERATWRFIDSNHEHVQGLPREDELAENRFQDGRFQPYEYKWIMSIEIPSQFRPIPGVGYAKEQPIDKLVEVLKAVGQFPIEQTSDGVVIVAYKK